MTRCSNPNHARDVRRVSGCSTCGIARAAKDKRVGKSAARRAAEADSNARTRRIPREIFERVNETCDAVRDDPTQAPLVNDVLAVIRDPEGVARMRAWLRNLPPECQAVLRDANRKRMDRGQP